MFLQNKYGLKKPGDFTMFEGHIIFLGGKGVKVRVAT
jgi:hypothetical protein